MLIMMKIIPLISLMFLNFIVYAQDTIVQVNDEVIVSKVLEITPEIVKYKAYDNLEGPVYSLYVSKIYKIRYKNGKVEYFSEKVSQKESTKKNDTLFDSRDGQVYKTIKIGEQIWMAENLNYARALSWCYDTLSSNCAKYGRLYTYETAVYVCPSGWHLPSDEEWKKLEVFLGMQNEVELTGWRGTSPGQGKLLKIGGESGFDAKFGGYVYIDLEDPTSQLWFRDLNKSGYFWTSTRIPNSSEAYARELSSRASIKRSKEHIHNAYSVRCIKD